MWLYASSTCTGSNCGVASNLPWRTCHWSIHPVLWKVAGNHHILDYRATRGWILVISSLAQTTPVFSPNVFRHPWMVVPQCGLWLSGSQELVLPTRCQRNQYSKHWLLYVGQFQDFQNILKIHTFSIIFAKPVLIAATLLIRAFPSSRSHWLYPMSMLSFSPNCWLCWWASQDLM